MAGRSAAVEALRVPVSRPLLDCAHEGCGSHAIARLRTATGWANLCEFHYTNDNLAESREYCLQHGLDTVEKKIAHVRKLANKRRDPRAWLKNPKSAIARQWAAEVLGPQPEREPGQDDEEREAA